MEAGARHPAQAMRVRDYSAPGGWRDEGPAAPFSIRGYAGQLVQGDSSAPVILSRAKKPSDQPKLTPAERMRRHYHKNKAASREKSKARYWANVEETRAKARERYWQRKAA